MTTSHTPPDVMARCHPSRFTLWLFPDSHGGRHPTSELSLSLSAPLALAPPPRSNPPRCGNDRAEERPHTTLRRMASQHLGDVDRAEERRLVDARPRRVVVPDGLMSHGWTARGARRERPTRRVVARGAHSSSRQRFASAVRVRGIYDKAAHDDAAHRARVAGGVKPTTDHEPLGERRGERKKKRERERQKEERCATMATTTKPARAATPTKTIKQRAGRGRRRWGHLPARAASSSAADRPRASRPSGPRPATSWKWHHHLSGFERSERF